MQIRLLTDPDAAETEITIRCREADAEVVRLLATLRAMDRKLTGEKDGELHLIAPKDIYYADTVDKKTVLYAAKAVYETPLRLYEIEDRLAAHDFIRISKASVVNFGKVQSIRPEYNGRLLLTLQNGETLIASRQYALEIKKLLEVT